MKETANKDFKKKNDDRSNKLLENINKLKEELVNKENSHRRVTVGGKTRKEKENIWQ